MPALNYPLVHFTLGYGTIFSDIAPLSYVPNGVYMSNAPQGAMTVYRGGALDISNYHSWVLAIFDSQPVITPTIHQQDCRQVGDYWLLWTGIGYQPIDEAYCPIFRDTPSWRAYVGDSTPPTPLNNWLSVPSISGKNGILLLSTIQSVYLNDGEPVNNALESYIDFIDDSKVAVLVGEQIDDLTKVTVKYIVPAGTYEYIKLVYKVGSAPTSVTDGTAVDILQAAKQVSISGIADGSTYFFKIFTDITESEPYEFTTVRPEGENFFAIDLSSDGRDTMRYNASKTIHVQADGVYGLYDVDYYAAQGALADPTSPSNPTYTISNGEVTTANNTQRLCWAYDVTANQRIIPANCTLWFEFDAYFLNSEGYLDWRMYNDQGVEKIYWCWDTKYNFSSGIWYNCKLEATVVNGIITNIKYYVDNVVVHQQTVQNHMLCIDEDNPVPLYFITFTTTEPTKLKNMKIYWE